MSDKHPNYYFEDGDILLKAENTTFLVHKIILSLSSEFFKDLFKSSKPSTNEIVKFIENQPSSENKSLPSIELNGETSESTERMLSFIYPGSYIKITWDNIEDLLRISEKFIISKITKYCHDFLIYNFQSNALLAFRMADKYSISELFKESSKLVLDDLEKYHLDTDYNLLSDKAKVKLMDSWFNYATSLNELVKGKTYFTSISKSSYNSTIKSYLGDMTPTLVLKPSELKKKIKSDNKLAFLKDNYVRMIKNYEPLKHYPSDENVWYIFVELE